MMKTAVVLLSCCLVSAHALASKPRSMPAAAANTARLPGALVAPRAAERVLTATSTGTGQAGYVHYFVLTLPDDTLEMMIGIERPDQRIAWSFPELGVAVSPFIKSGTVRVGDKDYQVEHLFGIRPFADDAAMRTLQDSLTARVLPWVDEGASYCELNAPPGQVCVSCLGFVLRILFPVHYPVSPALPAEFRPAPSNAFYTTEDLLLYLTGLHQRTTHVARLERIGELKVPDELRDELLRLVNAIDADRVAASSAREKLAAKDRPGARPASKLAPPRQRPRRKS